MQQHAAALDMTEETVAEAGAFMRPLDQAAEPVEDRTPAAAASAWQP
jgi:hypothetical protein